MVWINEKIAEGLMDNPYGSRTDSDLEDYNLNENDDIRETVIDGEHIRWSSNRPLKLSYAENSDVGYDTSSKSEQSVPKYNSWLIY